MTLQELNQLISLGEGAHIEFKRRVPNAKRIAKEIIAFANTGGGRILVGVGDDGTVVGVQDPVEEKFVLERALQRHSRPLVDITLERVTTEGRRDVMVVTVLESPSKPHMLVNGRSEPGAAYVRVKDKSVEASPEAIQLMRTREQTSNVTFEFGEREQLLMRYLNDYGQITVDQYASLIDRTRDEASKVLVTLAQADVIQLHADEKHDYFTLAYDLS